MLWKKQNLSFKSGLPPMFSLVWKKSFHFLFFGVSFINKILYFPPSMQLWFHLFILPIYTPCYQKADDLMRDKQVGYNPWVISCAFFAWTSTEIGSKDNVLHST